MIKMLFPRHFLPFSIDQIRRSSPPEQLKPAVKTKPPVADEHAVDQLETAKPTVDSEDQAQLVLKNGLELAQTKPGLLAEEDKLFLNDLKREVNSNHEFTPNSSQVTRLQHIVTQAVDKLRGPKPTEVEQSTKVSAPREPMKTLKEGAPHWLQDAAHLDMEGITKQSKNSIIADVLTKIFTLGLAKTRYHDGVGLKRELEANENTLLQQVKEKVAKNPDLAYAAISLPSEEVKDSIRKAITESRPDLFRKTNKPAWEFLVNDVYKAMIEAGPIQQGEGGTYLINGKEYARDKKLGEGGGGETWRYTCPDGPPLVMKAIKFNPGTPESAFLQEVDALRYAVGRDDLKHANIANFIGVTKSGDDSLLVMECVEGKNFRDVQRSIGNSYGPETNSLVQKYIMKQVVTGMVHVQENRQMMHLDLKPENVMIDSKTLTAKIIDFGLGKTTQQGDEWRAGTALYMAPEVYSSPNYDQHADTWSLGVMLFQAEFGRLPLQERGEQFPISQGEADKYGQRTAEWAENENNRIFPPNEDGTPLSPQEELFNALLHPDPTKRPRLSEVLNHPYFQMPEQEEERARGFLEEALASRW